MISVLYVDDEPALLDIGKIFLEEKGEFTVDTAPSAQAALGILAKRTYDAIISDYQMPGMNGIEFLKKIRKAGSNVPFIVFTGRGREEVVIQALNEGADFYIQKGGEPVPQFTELSQKILFAVRQRAAQENISALEQKQAEIINFLPDATFVINRDGKIVAWNRAMEEMTGISAADVMGKGDYEYAIPFYGERRPILIDLIFADPKEVERSYSGITRQGSTLMAETPFPRPKGEQRYLWGKAGPLFDEKGTLIGAIESIRDITDIRRTQADLLKRNEDLSATYEELAAQDEELRANLEEIEKNQKALQESGQRLRGITDSIPGIVFQFSAKKDGTQGLSYVSEQYEKLFGRKGDLATLLARFSEGIAPEDKDRFNASIAAAIQTETRWDFRGRYIRSNGSDMYFHAISEPVVKDDGLVFSGVLMDVTEWMRAESALAEARRRMEEIIAFLPDPTFVIDRDHKVVAWNRAMEALTGIPAAEMVGRGDYEYARPFYGTKRPILIDLVQSPADEIQKKYSFVSRDGSVLTAETGNITLRGRQRILWGRAAPLLGSGGEITGAIETIRDVTEQRRHAEALVQANRKLNLLSSVTRHDIINKITVLRGLLEFLRNRPEHIEADALYAKMKRTIAEISGIIEFTRQYQDIGIAEPVWQDCAAILENCRSSAIDLRADVGRIEVFADPMLPKIFANLLDNTIRHGERARTVTVSIRASGSGPLVIVWEDDGKGVPADLKEMIFERGYGSHTGFGLFLAREILGLTGITIRETGEEGRGARFEIAVPEGKFRTGGDATIAAENMT